MECFPEDFVYDIKTTCCFTGHRRRDLPYCGNMDEPSVKRLVSMLELLIVEAYNAGYRTFISGMAEGIDLMCASIVHGMRARKKYPGIRIVCAQPYANQIEEMHTPYEMYLHSMICANCDQRVIMEKVYCKGCYRERNSFMTDHASLIIGAIKEKPMGSGTLQTVNMAKEKGLSIKVISLDTELMMYLDKLGDNEFKILREKKSGYLI